MQLMKILLVGSGGREHALAWKLAQSSQVSRIFVAPGNGGTATAAKCQNVPIPAADVANLCRFALENAIDLTVVGPEAPLVLGLVDQFADHGLAVFGPSMQAAQLEGSKAFAKDFMQRHAIPTGWSRAFTRYDDARDFLGSLETPPVLKASGLAAGKGVLLPDSMAEAALALEEMMVGQIFGPAGETVLIEERLSGPEMSVLAFCDGQHFTLMPVAQDHKRLLDGDQGPNTGGMGAFAPSPLATPERLAEIARTVIRPTLDGIAGEGSAYVGVLYAGLMLTQAGPQVLEFNCRFGDPETQVVLPLLRSDLVDALLACVEGRLAQTAIEWADQAAVAVVMAAGGYPDVYEKGHPIHGLPAAQEAGCVVFHAGTALHEGEVVTNGGRVLAVCAQAQELSQAASQAYAGVEQIRFEQATFRRDIGR
jgi:phosphoribosylamine--glycine ligase